MGDCSDAMARGQQNSPLKEGLGQSRVQTSPENLPLHSQRSLCPGGHGGQGDGGQMVTPRGLWSIPYIPIYQVVPAHKQNPTDSDPKG